MLSRASLSHDSRWLTGLAVVLFAAPILLHQVLPASSPSWIPVAVASVTAVAAFLLWPARGLLVFATFVLFIDTIEMAAGSGIKQIDEIVLPVIVLVTLVTRWRLIWSRVRPVRELAIVGALLAGIASSLLNGVPFTIWLPGLVLFGKGIALLYVALLLDASLDDVRWAGRILLGVGGVVLAIALLELLAPGVYAAIGLTPAQPRAGLPALKSLFYHPLLFAWFCGFIGLYLFAYHAVLRRRSLLVLALAFSVGTILAARRRTIIGMAAGLATGIGLDLTRREPGTWERLRRWIPAVIGTVVLALAFLPAFSGLYALTVERYVTPGADGSGSGAGLQDDTPARFALYQGSAWIARDYFPLGAGLGRYGSWISRTHYSDLYVRYGLDKVYGLSPGSPQFITDTFWPEVLGELGVVGLAGYLVFIGALGVDVMSAARRPGLTKPMMALTLGTALVFTQTLVESLASPIFNSPPQTYLIMLAIGVTLGMRRPDAQPEPVP